MKTYITTLIALCTLVITASAFAQKTQVSVQSGKVKAQTQAGTVTVNAGQKGVLKETVSPVVAPDEPMVDDLIQMDKWVQEEKGANRMRIDLTSIQIYSFDSVDLARCAGLFEMSPNVGSDGNTVRFGLTSILKNPKVYDMQGNLVPFELQQIDSTRGYYYMHFQTPPPPGRSFKFVGTSDYVPEKGMIWKDGALWNIQAGNCSPNCLNYFKVILPKSAVFVRCSRPLTTIDTVDGRVAVTIRNYTGPNADGMYNISFLWPNKDDTEMADLPPQYRGLEKPAEPNNAAYADYYHAQLANILAGSTFNDQSTPINAMLTLACAILHKEKELLANVSYLCMGDLNKAAAIIDNPKILDLWKAQLIDQQDFLSTPAWSQVLRGKNNIHPIYTCNKGSSKRADTLAFVHLDDKWYYRGNLHRDQDGKWYYIGNMGNERDTDVNAFEKFIVQTPQSRLEALPWDNAGPEVLQIYDSFVQMAYQYPGDWFVLRIKLVGGGFWQQAGDAFNRCEQLFEHKGDPTYISCLVWQGHLLDIAGKRDEAIAKYHSALSYLDEYKKVYKNDINDIENYSFMRHDQWKIVLNYKWVKARLEMPFTKQMIGK